ncbi:acyl-CoA dehydrogenase family protein [Streptomyces sp. NPDC050256]|uniref:acyl-CoA dehydrogenase family protein n=1 Tax=unclassified Streptomyces TaxID=2593676 RepID=UPI0037B9B19E
MTDTLTNDLVSRAGRAAEPAGLHAAEADRTGELDAGVVRALTSAGFARHFVPAKWGGSEGTFTDMTRAAALTGRSCASAAWCGTMFAYSARFCTHLPVEAQEEFWGDTPDTLWVSGLVPSGRTEAVGDGFVLNGRWNYVSGALFADWALLAGPRPGPGTQPPRFFAVPRADFTVEQTWDTVGMRGTGSHTVVLSDVTVPAHRTVALAEVAAGVNGVSDRTQHNVPLMAVGGLTCVAPILGSAGGMLEAYAALVADKRGAEQPGVPGGGTAVNDVALARAAADLDAASFLTERAAAALDAGEARLHGVRNARDTAHVSRLLVASAQELMRTAGTGGQDAKSPLQRHWRDMSVASTHAALRFERAATAFTDFTVKNK